MARNDLADMLEKTRRVDLDAPRETIVPRIGHTARTLKVRDSLPALAVSPTADGAADYRIIGTLGEGGMGVVSLAEQTSLRREVAVKAPRGSDAHQHVRALEEAYVMGRMEHPNVVPAYGLGRSDTGQPLLVMKRVEGVDWDRVLRGQAEPPGGAEADLEWHLRVLLQVCNALRFAHSRRVVHRDIKPENVMIGEFGEVYLLDWGIALSLDEEAIEGFPTRETSQGLAGTPAFMAPEMTHEHAMEVDERTDVFLLGATLHSIIASEPPHQGDGVLLVLLAARLANPPEYDESTPSGLAAIARRAMAADKSERYASVSDFAAAVEDYLAHRVSYTLSDAASVALASATLDAATHAGITTSLLEAEFGFRQALNVWSQNEAAREGLQTAIEERAWASLNTEEVSGAKAAIEQLPAPNPELAEALSRLERTLAERAERVEYLERFERDLDLSEGMLQRQRAVIAFGAAFVAQCWLEAWTYHALPEPAGASDWIEGFWKLLLIAGVITVIFRGPLFRNRANLRLVSFFWSVLLGIFGLRLASSSIEVSGLYAQLSEVGVIWMGCMAIGINTGRHLTLMSLGYGAVIAVGMMSGRMWVTLAALGAQHLFFFGLMAWMWRPARALSSQRAHSVTRNQSTRGSPSLR